MRGNGRINQIAPQPPESRQGAILVGAGKLAVADHIGGENRGELPGLGHRCPSAMQHVGRGSNKLP